MLMFPISLHRARPSCKGRRAVSEGVDILRMAGGDGMVNSVAAILIGSDMLTVNG